MADKLDLLTIGEASNYLGVSIDTLRRWEKKGKLTSMRSPGGHRYFTKDNLDSVFGRKYERATETKPREIKSKVVEEGSTPPPPPRPAPTVAVLDRPTREIQIPETPLVRISKDQLANPPSLLTPVTPNTLVKEETPTPKEANVTADKKPTVDQKTKWIVLSVVGFGILSLIFFLMWRSSQTVLSPVP